MRRLLFRLVAVGSVAGLLGGVLVVLPAASPPSPSPLPAPTVTRTGLVGATTAVGRGWSTTVPGAANLVGVQWDGDANTQFAVEARRSGGGWSAVGTIAQNDALADPGSADARHSPAGHASEPVWVGNASEVRIRVVAGQARGLALNRVVAPKPRGSESVAGAAVPAKPGIVPRAGWGADEGMRLQNCPAGPDYDAKVQLAVVHHTDNSNDYGPGESAQLVRSIYAYHVVALGYCDIAYNFLIDRFGTIFEGRYGGIAKPVHGAHAIGFNTNSTGVSLIGNYQVASPSPAQIGALDALLAWKLAIHGVNPAAPVAFTTNGNDKFAPGTYVFPAVIGHQDTWFTDCPGVNVEALLPSILADVGARIAAAPGSYWHEWEPLGGVARSGPGVASWEPGRLDAFARGTDDQLWHRWFDGVWHEWEPLGGVLRSDPAVVSWGPGRLDAFVRGTDNRLWHRWFDGIWRDWEPLQGGLASGPAVASWAPGRLDVFVRGTDNGLAHLAYAGAWSGWQSLGGTLTSDPAVASWVSGRLDVFVRGADNALHHLFYSGGWSQWEWLGGSLGSDPAAAAWSDGRLDVFVSGSGGGLYHKWYSGRWFDWEWLGGALAAAPDAVSWQPDRVDVFARGTDEQLWHRWYSSDLYP